MWLMVGGLLPTVVVTTTSFEICGGAAAARDGTTIGGHKCSCSKDRGGVSLLLVASTALNGLSALFFLVSLR